MDRALKVVTRRTGAVDAVEPPLAETPCPGPGAFAGSRRPGRAPACAAFLAAVLAWGCSPGKSTAAPAGLGRAIATGHVRALMPSADGAFLAYLDGCEDVKVRFLPPETARCNLRVVPAAGGDAAKVAAGVATLPGGIAWSQEGRALAALGDYDFAAASGTLVLWRDGVARTLAAGVTFDGFGAHGELGFVADGWLSVMLPGDAGPRRVAGADRMASFDFSPMELQSCDRPDGILVRLVARKVYAAGGALLQSDCRMAQALPLERGHVGDYGFARSSPFLAYTVNGKDGAALRLVQTAGRVVALDLGRRVQSFAFGPDGRAVAFVADATPGKQGNLHLGGPGRKDVILAREVGDFRWAAAAQRLVWVEKYEPRLRVGVAGAGGPDLAPRALAQNVSDVEISPDGNRVAYLQHSTHGGYSVDLGLARLGAPASEKPGIVARGVFGFSFSPDGKWLFYRTRCARNAEACDLERIPAAGLAPGAKPEAIAPGVKSFEFDPRDPERLLVTWQRADMVALDIAVWAGGKLTQVDTHVLPGSARFLGPDSRRVAYVVVNPKRPGVYVADLPGK